MILATSMVMVFLLGTGTAFAWDYVDLDNNEWISGLSPANGSTISTSSTTITATFEFADYDTVWGKSITLDGVALTCSETLDGMLIHVSCPVTNLGGGPHQYTAAFWGSYEDGDTYEEWYLAKTVAFNVQSSCTAGTPSLSLSAPNAYWGTYANYLAGVLSVDWTVSNTAGSVTAYNTVLNNDSNTNGVTKVVSSASLGTIAGGSSATGTLKYGGFVSGVYTVIGSWHTVNSATAQDECGTSYSYGG